MDLGLGAGGEIGLAAAEAEHREAMDLADRAMLAQASGDADAWHWLTLETLERERRAPGEAAGSRES